MNHTNQNLAELFFIFLKDHYGIEESDISKLISSDEVNIPIMILSNRKLGPMECIVKFLKENMNWGFSKISKLTNRDSRTIWCMYNNAKKKENSHFITTCCQFDFPLSIISNRKYSALENIILHLKNRKSLHEISIILNRTQNTIKTLFYRAKKKSVK